MYEQKSDPPLIRKFFARRLCIHVLIAFGLIAFSIALGMAGYSGLEHLSPLDSFLNTAMLLGGMGPVNPPVTDSGKLFAGLFALYAGLVFIVTAALLFTPLLHRLMHHFHWDDK
ncbi:MAG TPA: hypothetical protein VEW08_17875 [Steroidobacteraceae bacterium]|nr:hypothetical protein [Steroidobacteraceae bacterium]